LHVARPMMSLDRASVPHDERPTLIRPRPARVERRGSARLPIEIDVHVEGAAESFDATTGDLSSGGMFLLTQRELPLSAQIALSFTLPNGQSLAVTASVQWQHTGSSSDWTGTADADLEPTRGPGVGVAFLSLSPEAKALLERFCSLREALYRG
jgi:c-di-GMP-binding flagellar brake protein YcgR